VSPRRSAQRISGSAEAPLGVECAFPNTEVRLAKPGAPRSRRNLLARALTWLRKDSSGAKS
jgi:hypothetical protein